MGSNFSVGGSSSGYSRQLWDHHKITRAQGRPPPLKPNSIYKQNNPKVQPGVIARGGHLLTRPNRQNSRPRTSAARNDAYFPASSRCGG